MKQMLFLKFPCFLYNPVNVGNLISSPSSFPKPNLDIWKFLVHIMLKASMQDVKRDLISMGDECNCLMVSIFFGTISLGSKITADGDCSHLISAMKLKDAYSLEEKL